MNARRIKAFLRPATAIISLYAILLAGCGPRQSGPGTAAITLSGIPASRLYFRYEADVPAPQLPGETLPADRDAGILADFQTNRPADELVRTLASPDNRRILAVYRREGDAAEEFRLDMYTKEGKLLRPVTPDNLAVHFQEIIRWAPDSSAVAFVATLREVAVSPTPVPLPSPAEEPSPNETPADETSPTPQSSPTPNLPPVMAFRTEQIYLCDSEAADLRPLTRNEGFIYYYFVWSPDSTMLAAMATHSREWQELERKADEAGMLMTPLGRPRIIERTGRERRLDDGLTSVRPVWSPDSTKVATAFDTQIRIYDAAGDNPTQAAIPLRNELLISSKAFDDAQAANLNAANTGAAPDATPQPTTLPDPNTLVSFNPIVQVAWTAPDVIYFETAYIKQMKNAADSVVSFARWHRLLLSPPPAS